MNAKSALIKELKDLVEYFNKSKSLEEKMLIANKHTELLLSNISLMESDCDFTNVSDEEVWKNIKKYEGIYQVSNYGAIKSLEHFFIKNRRGGESKMAVYQPERIRTKRYSKFGYLTTSLWLDGKSNNINLHRLVAEYYVYNPKKYPQVLHKDDNPANAFWRNLEWGTQSKNIQDAADRGRGFRGVKNGNSKLKAEDIPQIRKLILEGVPSRKIAKMFGVTKTPILLIKNNQSWIDYK
jgi:hypothetical protein